MGINTQLLKYCGVLAPERSSKAQIIRTTVEMLNNMALFLFSTAMILVKTPTKTVNLWRRKTNLSKLQRDAQI